MYVEKSHGVHEVVAVITVVTSHGASYCDMILLFVLRDG
jgi:hypothetical protein